jgi:sulfite dehydrogenase (quinone) subunit SoeC
MHPAFSVIFFTTLSGMGYGLWSFIALHMLIDKDVYWSGVMFGLPIGFILTALGLLSSTFHLGKPLRAWRAFSQWRSSWLSREGVVSIACFIPALIWMSTFIWYSDFLSDNLLAMALATLSIATVICTAMIYASLKPIAAWRHPYVVPVYVLFALLTGGLLSTAIAFDLHQALIEYFSLTFIAIAIALAALKIRYWKAIDSQTLPSRASALGLSEDKIVSVFERPHTEANYLTKEMGFVLARKHSRRLRTISVLLFAALPIILCVLVWILSPKISNYLLLFATFFAYVGAAVERWLFFAEAKHTVMQYY